MCEDVAALHEATACSKASGRTERVVAWDDHLSRPRNNHTWAAKLRGYKGKTWLMFRESLLAPATASRNSPVSVTAGRTGTRAFAGKVHTRWHDGVDYARHHLNV